MNVSFDWQFSTQQTIMLIDKPTPGISYKLIKILKSCGRYPVFNKIHFGLLSVHNTEKLKINKNEEYT